MSQDGTYNNLYVSSVSTIPAASLSRTDLPVPPIGSIVYNLDDTSVYVSKGPGIGWAPIGSGIIAAPVIITAINPSTNCINGALVVDGGVGIGGNLNVCSLATFSDTTNSTSCITGAVTIAGGLGVAQDVYFCGHLYESNTTQSTNTTTGAIVVSGGMGIAQNLNVGGIVSILNDTASMSYSTGALVVTGGVGIGGNLNTNGQLTIGSTSNSTSCTTGAVTIAGGLGIAQDVYICGQLYEQNMTNSTSTSTGAIIVSGGVGIAQNLNVGGVVNITNDTSSSSTLTGALVVTGGVGIGGNLNVGGTVQATQLATAGLPVVINGAAQPTSGLVLITTGTGQTATWQTVESAIGILPVSNGGTGVDTLTSGNVLVGAGTSPVTTTKVAPVGDFVGTTDTQTLTYKTIIDSSNNVTASSLFASGPITINVSNAATPSVGQVLTLNTGSPTYAATWQAVPPATQLATTGTPVTINTNAPLGAGYALVSTSASVATWSLPTLGIVYSQQASGTMTPNVYPSSASLFNIWSGTVTKNIGGITASGGSFTVPVAGLYNVCIENLFWGPAANNGSSQYLQLWVESSNDALYHMTSSIVGNTNFYLCVNISGNLLLAAGSNISLHAWVFVAGDSPAVTLGNGTITGANCPTTITISQVIN